MTDPDSNEDRLAPWRSEAPVPEQEQLLAAQFLGPVDGDMGRALTMLSQHANERHQAGEYRDSATAWSLLLRIMIVPLGDDHPQTLLSVNNLAFCYDALGEARRASPLYEEALAKCRTTLGDDHPQTLTSLNNLASCYEALGEARRALPLFEEAVERRRAVLGNDHPDTLTSLSNLAVCYDALGEARRALPLLEEALAKCRTMLGDDHPQTLTSLSNLASCYRALGEARRALPFYEQAFATRRAVLGEKHADTLNSLNNLACCYDALGKSRRALPFYEEALGQRRAVLGANHPDTLNSLNNLAFCYRALGEARRALPFYEEALAKCRTVLGEDHPDTLNSLNNLACCYDALGEARRALPFHEEALAQRRAVLGENHPDTLNSLNNLAFCYNSLGEARAAWPLFEEALTRCGAVLGADHPQTMRSLHNLAFCYWTLGEARRALPLFEEALAKRRAVLGHDHPETLSSLINLASCYYALGETRRALPFYENVLSKYRTALGNDHPDTLTSLSNLAVCYQALGEPSAAAPLVTELLQRLGQASSHGRGRDWAELAASAAAGAVALRQAGEELAWRDLVPAISAGFAAELEEFTPGSEDWRKLREHFVAAHAAWLQLCLIDDATAEAPRVLAAIQGREMAALVLAELEAHQSDYPESDPRRRYLDVLHQLRRLRLRLLGEGRPGGAARVDEVQRGADAKAAAAAERERWAGRRAHLEELRKQQQALRRELAAAHPDYRLVHQPPEFDAAALQVGLAADAVLVLLFTVGEEAYACCLAAAAQPRLLALAALPAAHRQVRRIIAAGRQQAGIRRLLTHDGPGLPSDTASDQMRVAPPESVARELGQALWQPLREAYPDARHWHVCTHQSLHILPLTLGAAVDHEVHAYPGLLFYYQRHHQPALAAVSDGPPLVALHIDPAPAAEFTTEHGPPPIPFVEAEAALLRGVWGAQTAVTRGQQTLDLLGTSMPRIDLWCVAAHGQETREGPPRVLLAFDRETQAALHLDSQGVLAAAQRPRHLFLSACVVARLYELEGEPLGPVSAFFLHGAEFVAAPLQEIDDFYAPLLSGLFHLHYQEHRDPERALRRAKTELLAGDWPQRFIDLVYVAYLPVMVEVLQRAGTRPSWLVPIWDWPLPAAARRHHDKGGGTVVGFQDRYCRTAQDRETLARQTLDELVAARNDPPGPLRDLIAWTAPFGMPRREETSGACP